MKPLITIEGGKPKTRLNLAAAWLVVALALPLPVRARIAFSFIVNFACNHVLATSRVVVFFVGRQLANALVFLSYFCALSVSAALARLTGRDYLGTRDAESFFKDKAAPDSSGEEFLRPY